MSVADHFWCLACGAKGDGALQAHAAECMVLPIRVESEIPLTVSLGFLGLKEDQNIYAADAAKMLAACRSELFRRWPNRSFQFIPLETRQYPASLPGTTRTVTTALLAIA
ncbi:MAG: hypothetical protein Q7T01_03025 [bacterium]|nr:hypothetical protein [bacterium]